MKRDQLKRWYLRSMNKTCLEKDDMYGWLIYGIDPNGTAAMLDCEYDRNCISICLII